MNCLQCGADIGNQLGLCANCKGVREGARGGPFDGAPLGGARGRAGPTEGPPPREPRTAVEGVDDDLRPAGFWLRFGALIIDATIVYVVQWALLSGLMSLFVSQLIGHHASDPAPGSVIVAALVLFLTVLVAIVLLQIVYYALFEGSSLGATPGKLLFGMRVVTVDEAPISRMRSLGRNSAKLLSSIIFGIGFLMAAFTSNKQALHDRIAGALVVRRVISPVQMLVGIALAVACLTLTAKLDVAKDQQLKDLHQQVESMKQKGEALPGR